MAAINKAWSRNGWLCLEEQRYEFWMISSPLQRLQREPRYEHVAIVELKSFDIDATKSPERPYGIWHRDGTDLLAWLHENLRGRCRGCLFRVPQNYDRERFAEIVRERDWSGVFWQNLLSKTPGVTTPALAVAFTNATLAVEFQLRFG